MKVLTIAALLCAAFLTACGGGSGTHIVPTIASSARALTIQMLVPSAIAKTSANTRKAQYVSPSTVSGVLTFYRNVAGSWSQVGSPVVTDLSPTSKACMAASGGRTCTITVPGGVPVTDPNDPASFTNLSAVVALYDAPNGSGNLLSYGGVIGAGWNAYAGGNNVLVVDLGGVPARFTLAQSAPAAAGATSVAYMLQAFDADGNPIVTPAATAAPNGATLTYQGTEQIQDGSSLPTFSDTVTALISPHGALLSLSSGSTSCGVVSPSGNVVSSAPVCPMAVAASGTPTAPTAPDLALTNAFAPISGDALAVYVSDQTTPTNLQGAYAVAFPIVDAGTTISSAKSPAASIKVMPPLGYTGSVSLRVDRCWTPTVSWAWSPSIADSTATVATNGAASPLVSVSPASGTSANGSSVSFAVSPVAAGECALADSFGGTHFVTVAW